MFDNVRLAFEGIWSHKLRSFLTMLGIIIGIGSIIAIVSSIEGTTQQLKESLIGAGNNNVSIDLYQGDNPYESGFGFMSSGQSPPLLTKEQKAAVAETNHVEQVTFFLVQNYVYNIYYGKTAFQGGTVYGIDESYLKTCGYRVHSGRSFVKEDYDKYHKVCLVDNSATESLFPGEDPVGKIIEIGSEPFTVVGMIQQDETFSVRINNYEEYQQAYQSVMGTVFIPNTDWPIVYSFDQPENLIIKADSTDNMSKAGSDAAKVLNSFIPDSSSRFSYRANDIMEKVRSTQQLADSTNSMMIGIAAISLLVGGIGVMNIMLVSVIERTREIGLKKAIGARKATILGQFLTEAAVLTTMGGLIGVGGGIAAAKIISRVVGTPSAISVPWSIIAVAFSTVIGIIFGAVPSWQAANLNPIDALRSE